MKIYIYDYRYIHNNPTPAELDEAVLHVRHTVDSSLVHLRFPVYFSIFTLFILRVSC